MKVVAECKGSQGSKGSKGSKGTTPRVAEPSSSIDDKGLSQF